MLVKVDQEKCIGCSLCENMCPDVFEIRDDGKSHVKNASRCENCDCDAAVEACPVDAITYQK